mmetsp:Transcript_9352/g.12866  ORF Transcript_9352/g.12866 Transcript_9352/m.12866 type:complete len:296 (+) Transcript_9352:37-924(+)
MDYLFYEAFESEAWEMASTVIIIFGLFFVAISSYAHFYSIAFVTCDVVLPDPVRKLNREEFIYYGFSLFVLLPTGVSVLIFNPDNSLKTCDWLLRAALFYLFIGNFLLYRLLITKSLIYDPMQQMRTLYQLTWWIIHLLYLPLSLYGVASGFIFQREKREIGGTEHCVEMHTIVTPSVFSFCDLVISVSAILILAAPSLKPGCPSDTKIVVFRNTFAMTVATISTFLLLLYSITASSREGEHYYIVKHFFRLGALDSFINFSCVTLSWPLSFYLKIMSETRYALVSRVSQRHISI